MWEVCSRGSPCSREKARALTGKDFPSITIQEAGLDGFWIHRVLQSEGIQSCVVDAASILTSRRRRRAKTDKIDGEALVRTALSLRARGAASVLHGQAPKARRGGSSPDLPRAQNADGGTSKHVNRIKGLLLAQGVFDRASRRTTSLFTDGYSDLARSNIKREAMGMLEPGRLLVWCSKVNIIRGVEANTRWYAVQFDISPHAVGDHVIGAGRVSADTQAANNLATAVKRHPAAECDNPARHVPEA
jgi:hypothetical protein